MARSGEYVWWSVLMLVCVPWARARVPFTTLDVPGAVATVAYGINKLGTVVGTYQVSDGTWHGFEFSGGDYTFFDYPQAKDTIAIGINDSGQIVGWYDIGQGFLTYGFSYDGKTFTSIQYDSKLITEAHGVNNAGHIVGQEGDTQNQLGYELSGGKFTIIAPPGGEKYGYALAMGINNIEQIAGYVVLYTDNKEGFEYTNGGYQSVSYPGAVSTEVDGINDNGVMVGYYAYNNFAFYGFATRNGKFVSLTYPGASYTICYGINNAGQIVGEAVVGSATHGFLTNPITAADFEDK
jgi:probable HAF family extracellular repeat protein